LSNSAVWLAAGALNKKTKISGKLNVEGLNIASLQGDKEILNILSLFGANVDISGNNCSASGNREMKGIEIDAANIPDLVPVIAVVAAGASGVTYIKNAARLRIKESDRLSTIATCLRCLGGNVDELPDGLIIRGSGRLKGGFVDSFNDHRIVMSMVLAALICDNPVTITNSQAINKSYPNFFEDFKKLSGEVNFI